MNFCLVFEAEGVPSVKLGFHETLEAAKAAGTVLDGLLGEGYPEALIILDGESGVSWFLEGDKWVTGESEVNWFLKGEEGVTED